MNLGLSNCHEIFIRRNLYGVALLLLFLFLVNISHLRFFHSDQGIYTVMCDGDEFFYVREAMVMSQGRDLASVYFEHKDEIYPNRFWSIPHWYFNTVIGWVLRFFKLDGVHALSVLDIVSASAGFFSFTLFFSLLTKSINKGAVVAFVFLLCPWFLSYLGGRVVPGSPLWLVHGCLPIERAVLTQISYSLMGIVLAGSVWLLNVAELASKRGSLLLGALTGFFIYLYFFTWAFLSVFVSLVYLMGMIGTAYHPVCRSRVKSIALSYCVFLVGYMATASFGIYLLWGVYGSSFLSISQTGLLNIDVVHAAEQWFWSNWCVGVLIVSLLVLLVTKTKWVRLHLLFLIVTLLSHIILMNLQPAINSFLQPNHWACFYIAPMLTGLFFSFMLIALEKVYVGRVKVVNIIIPVICVVVALGRWNSVNLQGKNSIDELYEYIRDSLGSNKVIVTNDYFGLEPSSAMRGSVYHPAKTLALLTNNNLLIEEIFALTGVTVSEQLERHLLQRWFFTGEMGLSFACDNHGRFLVEKNFWSQWISIINQMKLYCHLFEEVKEDISACQLLQKYRVDYLVNETAFATPFVGRFDRAIDKVWRSNLGDLELYRINRPLLLEQVCGSKN